MSAKIEYQLVLRSTGSSIRKIVNEVDALGRISKMFIILYVDEILKRVGKMWDYGGHYHSFVTYINAIFRVYI